MRSTRTAVLAGALLLGSAVAAPAASAASPSPDDPVRRTTVLKLWVQREAATPIADSPGTAARVITLTCDPDGGTHPHAEKACELLRGVDGDFRRLNEQPNAFCPAVYDPVTAYETGLWRGREVGYKQTYGNSCWLAAATGAVFTFR